MLMSHYVFQANVIPSHCLVLFVLLGYGNDYGTLYRSRELPQCTTIIYVNFDTLVV